MRLKYSAFCLLGFSLLGQTPADALAGKMLARVSSARWGVPYVGGNSAGCGSSIPKQMAIHASDQWSHHCVSAADGLTEESFFYAFDEHAGPIRLRVDVRTEAPSDDITHSLSEQLTKRFGAPAHGPQMIEIGFRRLRYGQPVAGEHWSSAKLHYFVHQNQIDGDRKGVELIVFDVRLFKERTQDDFILQADVLFQPDSPSRPLLQLRLGESYIRLLDAAAKTPPERQPLAQHTSREVIDLLRRAREAPSGEKGMLLLAANGLVVKLTTLLGEDAETSSVKRQLAAFQVKLGSMTHYGGLAYNHDLLWRVWREFPETEAGQLAFVELQQRGWDTGDGMGCPPNPDRFRTVIERGEAFLAQHPNTAFRKEVLFTLAVANESWWSIAHAPADDAWVSQIPYPRMDANRKHAEAARERAINYYQEIVNLAPDTSEAASALRRLPRIRLGLDTGQRRFFCSYC